MSSPKGRRISIPDGTYIRYSNRVNAKLQRLYRRYRHKKLTKPEVRKRGKKVIDEQFEDMTKFVDRFFKRKLGKTDDLSSDDKKELDKWRDETIESWNGIVDDM